jgi:hypothetical protein
MGRTYRKDNRDYESDKFSKYDRPTKFEKNPKTYYKYNQDENEVENLDDEEISNDDYDRP